MSERVRELLALITRLPPEHRAKVLEGLRAMALTGLKARSPTLH